MATYIEPRGPSPSWANLSHVYGLVGLDWLNANGIWWDQTPAGRNRTRCEAVSVENCRRLKAAGLAKRCMIYHNLELALEWEESQRSVMYDQRKASYFLRYNNGTICERCAATPVSCVLVPHLLILASCLRLEQIRRTSTSEISISGIIPT
eukprot:SAG31_NODE_2396_length_5784_cov_15.942656_5_plen_151_part_00